MEIGKSFVVLSPDRLAAQGEGQMDDRDQARDRAAKRRVELMNETMNRGSAIAKLIGELPIPCIAAYMYISHCALLSVQPD